MEKSNHLLILLTVVVILFLLVEVIISSYKVNTLDIPIQQPILVPPPPVVLPVPLPTVPPPVPLPTVPTPVPLPTVPPPVVMTVEPSPAPAENIIINLNRGNNNSSNRPSIPAPVPDAEIPAVPEPVPLAAIFGSPGGENQCSRLQMGVMKNCINNCDTCDKEKTNIVLADCTYSEADLVPGVNVCNQSSR